MLSLPPRGPGSATQAQESGWDSTPPWKKSFLLLPEPLGLAMQRQRQHLALEEESLEERPSQMQTSLDQR